MKLKKLLLGSCVTAVSGGLLATILTSCGQVNIDDDLKVELDDQARFVDDVNFKDALKAALSTSSTWGTFKTAIVNELIYKWFENRASKSKDSKDKNDSFRTTLDEIKYNVDQDYKKLVDDLKAKYGSQHKWYLQNEHLSQYGGTEASYKHAKIIEQLRTKFIDNVFKFNYFTYRSGDEAAKYPQFFTNVNTYVKEDTLKNNANWERIGFYAKANPNYDVKDTSDIKQLAKHPDGDYATIQNFVFNKWYDTERPFFSSAALFKYAKPIESGGELSNIYNKDYAGEVKDPNETFPFFGGQSVSNGYTSSRGFYRWYKALEEGEFEIDGRYTDAEGNEQYNNTVSIPGEYSEDGQTVLLCSARQMIGGSNSLYVPYAVSAASLYNQMFDDSTLPKYATLNHVTQAFIKNNVGSEEPLDWDSDIILKNFFFVNEPNPLEANIQSRLDLNDVYGGLDDNDTPTDPTDDTYHCPIFRSDSSFKFFYGDEQNNGVRYITNNIQAILGKHDSALGYLNTQPWILELNEAGVHCQTIDAYNYVHGNQLGAKVALKNAVKFRLLQKLYYDTSYVSADLFSKSGSDGGKLKSYFTDNFDNIILEMAISEDVNVNIFRNIESYNQESPSVDVSFIKKVYDEQKFGPSNALEQLANYLNAIISYEENKKINAAVVTANNTIYKYRTTQIQNSKSRKGRKIFQNGLLAPLAIKYTESKKDEFNSEHYYSNVVVGVVATEQETKSCSNGTLLTSLINIEKLPFLSNIDSASPNTDAGFSPQVKSAKNANSNRFWFASSVVDKLMYSFMSNKTLANEIKQNTYEAYRTSQFPEGSDFTFENIIDDTVANQAIATTYCAPKLLTGDNNFASYAKASETDFWTTMQSSYEQKLEDSILTDGYYCDDITSFSAYLATMAYLAKNNFENFYKNIKIGDTEKAFIGYLSKYSSIDPYMADPYKAVSVEDLTKEKSEIPYDWSSNVDNIYDEFEYTGDTDVDSLGRSGRISFDQYWNVLNKDLGKGDSRVLGGFTGLQTSSNNQLDKDVGLQDAALKDFALATKGSVDFETGAEHKQNDGALFAWACNDTETAHDKYKIKGELKPVAGEGATINDASFDVLPQARKLACKIIECDTIDDLRSLSGTLATAIMGPSLFKDIDRREVPISEKDPIGDLKYKMVAHLLEDGEEGKLYSKAFQRVKNVELHNVNNKSKYSFEDGNNGYKLIMTQINKEDVLEKKLAPTWNKTTSKWELTDSPLSLDEFWFIFCKMAGDSSIQQLAIADAVKAKYGDAKLVVHDAQLYNQFDSVWIKDWKKKPIGE